MVRPMLVNFIRENFMDRGFTQKLVENILDNTKIIKDPGRELTYMLTETNTWENGKNINMMDGEFKHMLMEIHTLENGKKISTMLQTTNMDAMERVLTHTLTETHTLENGKRAYDMVRELLRMQTEKLKKVFGKKIN